MAFVNNADEVAREVMLGIQPDLAETYSKIIGFLAAEPSAASAMRGRNAPSIGSTGYIHSQAIAFSSSRQARSPQAPSTIPDEMVSIILRDYFDVPEADLARAKREHLLSMGAENLVGDLLERYLASIMEPRGWLWCSGSMVKAVDFIKPPVVSGNAWSLLQVKNRDNSENSSSSAIRMGTDIDKWHRTFSKRVGANWAAFPDASIRPLVSEADFKSFATRYLRALRNLD